MTGLESGLLLIVWLMLGGWAFRRTEFNRRELVAGFIGCLVLAPFAAGACLADIRFRNPASAEEKRAGEKE